MYFFALKQSSYSLPKTLNDAVSVLKNEKLVFKSFYVSGLKKIIIEGSLMDWVEKIVNLVCENFIPR